MSTVDVNAKFVNGKPSGIEARYVMKTEGEWSRFMRFMERYAEDNGLGFSKK
jgi:photosystem II reaction center protein Psb28